MALTDLTGTTWKFNDFVDLGIFGAIEFNIEFDLTNDTSYSYSKLSSTFNSRTRIRSLSYYNDEDGSTTVYQYLVIDQTTATWSETIYQTITITGGDDATNATLIAWLETLATQQETPSAAGTNHTKIGSLNITKKTVGGLEVLKEVVNGITVYEKGTTPSGFEVTLTDTDGYVDFGCVGALDYSLDNGETWIPITSFPITVNTTQIKFRGYCSDTDFFIAIGTQIGWYDVFEDNQSGTMQTSNNVVLSADTTFYFETILND